MYVYVSLRWVWLLVLVLSSASGMDAARRAEFVRAGGGAASVMDRGQRARMNVVRCPSFAIPTSLPQFMQMYTHDREHILYPDSPHYSTLPVPAVICMLLPLVVTCALTLPPPPLPPHTHTSLSHRVRFPVSSGTLQQAQQGLQNALYEQKLGTRSQGGCLLDYYTLPKKLKMDRPDRERLIDALDLADSKSVGAACVRQPQLSLLWYCMVTPSWDMMPSVYSVGNPLRTTNGSHASVFLL